MKLSVPALVISTIILFLGFIVMPTYYMGCVQWRDDMTIVQNSTRNFVDQIIDSGQITKDMEADFNLALASCSSMFTYEVVHEVKVTDPDPILDDPATPEDESDPYHTITKWVYTEDVVNFNTGDFVTVKVEQITTNFFQRIAANMLGMFYTKKDCTLTGMVR